LPPKFKTETGIVEVRFSELLFYTQKTKDDIVRIISGYYNQETGELFRKNIERKPTSEKLRTCRVLLENSRNVDEIMLEIGNVIRDSDKFDDLSLVELEEILYILEDKCDEGDVFQIFEDTMMTRLMKQISDIVLTED
jgi:hypothetical protein